MDFKNKVAVVTGAASGIGRSIALAFAGQGADIVLADIDGDKMGEVAAQINAKGCRSIAVKCDVSRDEDVENLKQKALAAMGKVDILVNNAGVMLAGTVDKVSMKDWQWIVDINLLGVVRGVRAFLPHMLERGSGYIVNTSSVGGLITGKVTSVTYNTTKFAVTAFTEVLYKQLKPKGIGVSLLCPGGVATDIAKSTRYSGGDNPETRARTMAALAKLQPPDEIANMVVESMNKGEFLILSNPPRFRKWMLARAQDTQGFLDVWMDDPTKIG
jgi:NAD(P)-dependent dehydrogenase (short-subunit alcohol dehydrogenase family)